MIAHTVWLPKSSAPVSQLPFLVHPVIGLHPHSASSQPITFRMHLILIGLFVKVIE